MKPFVKAALISAASLCLFALLVFLLVRSGTGPGGRGRAPEEEIAKEGEPTPVVSEVETPAAPLEPLRRDQCRLTVEVVDAARKTRLRGARVLVLRSQDETLSGRIEWDSGPSGSGLYEITLLPGPYVVQAQCPRYKGERRLVKLQEGTSQSLRFELDRGTWIRGRVLTEGGAPIAGARVAAFEDLASPDATIEEILMGFIRIQELTGVIAADTVSASDGSYQLDGLEERYYTVRAVASGFSPNQMEGVPAPREQVDIILPQGVVLEGRVTDRSGRPVAQAEVAAYPEVETQDVFQVVMAKARPPIDTAKSKEDGSFTLPTLGAGLYSFLVKAKGYQTGEFTKVRVTPGRTSLEFPLDRGYVLRGTVKGPNEEPVARAVIRATPVNVSGGPRVPAAISFDDGSVKSDENGAFVFDDLGPGKYTLVCWHDLYETRQLRDVQASLEGQEIEIRLGAGGRLRGKVVDGATKAPIAGASVSVQDMGDIAKRDVTKEDGTFVLGGLRAVGRSQVLISAKGYGRLRQDVSLRENAEVEQVFELVPAASISGLVANSNGDGIPGARVMVRRGRPGGAMEQTIANGFTDSTGVFSLNDVEAGPDTWVEVKHGDYLPERTEPIELTSGQAVELEPIVLKLAGAVYGKVLGPDGLPVSGCSIVVLYEGDTELKPKDGGISPSGATNRLGEYEIKGLRTGVVTLLVKPVRHLEKKIDNVKVDEGARTRVDITLEGGRSIAGRVTDTSGNPVAGAEILVRDFGKGMKERRAASETDGTFEVYGIASPDFVELTVTHSDYAQYSDQRVPADSKNLEIVLKGLAVIKGFVVTPDGTAPESFVVQPQQSAPGIAVLKQLRAETYGTQDGSFEYRGLQAGSYIVQVRAPGYATTTVSDVVLADGEVKDLGRIELRSGGTVYGTVMDGTTGLPIAGARVQIVQGSSRFVRPNPSAIAREGGEGSSVQVTGAEGQFSFTGLKGGPLTLRVSHKDYITKEFTDINPDIVERSQGLVLHLDVGGRISGTVVDANGAAKADMPVYLIAGSGGNPSQNQTQKTDRSGRFSFESVAPGTYTVKAHRFGVPNESRTEAGEVTLEVASGESYEVTVTVQQQ